MVRSLLCSLLICVAAHAGGDDASEARPEDALRAYVAKEDASFGYEVVARAAAPGGGEALAVELTSQTWRGIPWKHWLRVFRPAKPLHPDAAVLVIAGGRIGKPAPPLDDAMAVLMAGAAKRSGCSVALLTQVPNQPLLGGRSEDALIAHTFDAFLRTGERDWPALLPMTKSAVRAMDALGALGRTLYGTEMRRFCVTGASKRGWTTWLTGASDPRVVAIAPMVIDTLNFRRQMPHQLAVWGDYSEQIKDYTERELQKRMKDHSRAPSLLKVVDPWSYRRSLTMPKLVMIGANDRYWPVDAARWYIDGLPGERALHYVPNAGHGLTRHALHPIERFFRLVLAGDARPRLIWRVMRRDAEVVLSVMPDRAPAKVQLWRASSATRDLRASRWTAEALPATESGAYVARGRRSPAGGSAHDGMLVEMTFETPAGALSLFSRAVVVPPVGLAPLDPRPEGDDK